MVRILITAFLAIFHVVMPHNTSDVHLWPRCPPGFYMDPQSSLCRRCSEGSEYMDTYNRSPRCAECSRCYGGKRTVAACTIERDTVCACATGFYENVEGFCSPAKASGPRGTASAGYYTELPAIMHADLQGYGVTGRQSDVTTGSIAIVIATYAAGSTTIVLAFSFMTTYLLRRARCNSGVSEVYSKSSKKQPVQNVDSDSASELICEHQSQLKDPIINV